MGKQTLTVKVPLFLLLWAVAAKCAWACYAPPAAQLMSVDEQVRLARDVAVVKVVSAVGTGRDGIVYQLAVQERLAGPERTTLTVTGSDSRQSKDTSFDRHADPVFWKHGGGRLMNDTDCVVRLNFVVGHSYLLFLGSPSTRRSAERIDTVNGQPDRDDKWLQYVKTALRQRQPDSIPSN